MMGREAKGSRRKNKKTQLWRIKQDRARYKRGIET